MPDPQTDHAVFKSGLRLVGLRPCRPLPPDAGTGTAITTLPFAAHEDGGWGCKWPLWPTGLKTPIACAPAYCGKPRDPAKPDGSYCPEHDAIAYVPVKPGARA